MKFYLYENGGGASFSHGEGGGAQKEFYAVALSSSYIEGGGGGVAESFHPIKRGGAQTILPCLEWGGHTKCRTCDFPIL